MYCILAADDDPVQLDLRRILFESAGHRVIGVLTTRQTTRAVAAGEIQLVVMDLRFPNGEGKSDPLEGLQLIRNIRELDRTVPIIVLSGWPEDLEGTPEEQMVSRVMMKPVRPAQLLAAAQELLASRLPS